MASTSILNDIKKLLGPAEDYTNFDPDIVLHINSALSILRQLGVGPKDGFEITGAEQTWEDFWQDTQEVPMTKSYIFARVKLAFDPPANSFLVEALKNQIAEFEWRANVDVETPAFKKGE